MEKRRKLLSLLLIMAGVVLAVATISVWVLYEAAFEDRKAYLQHVLEINLKVLESVATAGGPEERKEPAAQAAVQNATKLAIDLLAASSGFGKSGMFVLGSRQGDRIVFLAAAGHRPSKLPEPVAFASRKAEPMRRALRGQSGVIRSVDHFGTPVIAAYRPIPALGLGIVAKIDMAEFRAPFVTAVGISTAGALVILLLGGALFRRVGESLARQIEDTETVLSDVQRIANLGRWERNLISKQIWWSDEVHRIFGLKPGEFDGTKDGFMKLVHPGDRRKLGRALQRSIEEKTPYIVEYRVIQPGGTERIARAQAEVTFTADGRPARLSGTLCDVTDIKRTEAALRRSESRFRGLIDTFTQGILINRDRKALYANQALADMYGYAGPDEILALESTRLLVHPDSDLFQTRLRDELGPLDVAYKGVRKDGSAFWVEKRAFKIEWDGAPAICSIRTDVTERMQADETIRKSEERLRGAVESLQEGFALFDADDRLVTCNDEYRRLKSGTADIIKPGMGFADELQLSYERGLIPDARGREADYMRERLARHRQAQGQFLRELTDGVWVIIKESRTPDGGTAITYTDVTDLQRTVINLEEDRNREEKRAAEAHARLAAAVAGLEAAVSLFDADDRLVVFNDAFVDLNPGLEDIIRTGMTFEEFTRARIAAGLIPGEATGREEQWLPERLRQHREPSGPREITRQDGKRLLIHEQKLGDGGILTVVTDLTQIKRAEAAARESEQRALTAQARLATAVDGLEDAVYLYDSEDRLILLNDAARKNNPGAGDKLRAGTTYEELLRGRVAAGLIAEAWGGREEDWIQERLARHKEAGEPFEIARRDGSTLMVQEHRLADGGTLTVVTDITEMKRAERAHDLLAAAVEGVSDAIYLFDADDRLVLCNEAGRRFNPGIEDKLVPGITFEETMRARVAAGLIPDAQGREEEWIRERLVRHKTPGEPFELPRQDGRTYLVHEHHLAQGGIMTVSTDITKMKQAEAAARESGEIAARARERLAAAVDGIPNSFVLYDTNDKLVLCNQTFRNTFAAVSEFTEPGVKFEDLRRAAMAAGIFDVPAEAQEEWLRKRMEVHGNMREPFESPHADGTWRLVQEYNMPDGGTAIIGTDITEIKQAEQRVLDSKQDAEYANRAKTEFLATISHELRTPLNAVIGFSDTIRAEMFGPLNNEKYAEYIENIHESGEHLLELINDILDVSVIEANKLDLAKEPVNVAGVSEAAVRLVRPRADKDRVDLVNGVNGGLPDLIGDARRIKQILINLLSNAVKFTAEGKSVILDAQLNADGSLSFTVADQGIGMDPAGIETALTPFGQVDGDSQHRIEGTGLGLPLAKGLAESHGATLDIQSEPNVGTTVTVRFPPERVSKKRATAAV